MSLQLATLEDIQVISDQLSSLKKLLTEKQKKEAWPELLTPGQAAKYLNVSAKTLRTLQLDEWVEPDGRKKLTLYHRRTLDKWIEVNTRTRQNLTKQK